MNFGMHWSVWLLAGMAVGMLPVFGEYRILGFAQALLVLSAPFIIFTQAGAATLPFVLFYGGLMAASTYLYRRKRARDSRKLQKTIDEKKKRWGV